MSQTECYLDKLPVELLQKIIDYEPVLATCSRSLHILGFKHRYKKITGPKPSWTLFGKKLNSRSIKRFCNYLEPLLSNNFKAKSITVSVPYLISLFDLIHSQTLNLNLDYIKRDMKAQQNIDRIALMSSRIPKLETLKVTIPDETHLHKLPELKGVQYVAVTITRCTRYNFVGNLLREKFPNASNIYLDVQPKKYKMSKELQRQQMLEWAAEVLVICQYLRFANLKRLSIFGRIRKHEFFEAYTYFRSEEPRTHKPLDFEFSVMSSQTVLTVLGIFASELREHAITYN